MITESDELTMITQQIEEALQFEKRRIRDEIRAYPPPIPACDAQFNYLLERRELITTELGQLNAIAADRQSTAKNRDSLRTFVSSSQCLSRETKRKLSTEDWRLNNSVILPMIPLKTRVKSLS